jgi:hypothetical protein
MAEIDFEKKENQELLRNLYAYSRLLYSQLYKDERNWKGKGFEDYVHDAILKHSLNQDKYDPTRGPLEHHLKKNVIRQALTNDLPPNVKKAYERYRQINDKQREMSTQKTQIEEPAVHPDELGVVSMIVNNIDGEQLFKEIEAEINGDAVVEQIYFAIVCDKYDFSERAEICEDYKIPAKEFDNGKRRFMTILKRVFKKLNIKG